MHSQLQTIFSFFLGLMVVAVVGVGVNTFYPEPADVHQAEQQELWREMEAVQPKTMAPVELDAETQAKLAALQARQNELQDRIAAEREGWARNTSIVLVLFATVVMSVSLVRNDQLRVLSNGLLLGGLFTMVYGAGWVVFSGHSIARFFVVLFALAVTVGLGWLKFVRYRAQPSAAASSDMAAVADLEARVKALETWRHS
jgi:hypothetical protein